MRANLAEVGAVFGVVVGAVAVGLFATLINDWRKKRTALS